MDFANFTVMVVDDEQYYRSSICAAIEYTLGATVIEVDNGSEALSYLKFRSKPDLILLDINMPMMDGITLLEKIRKDMSLKEIAVIPYTQDASEEMVIKLVKLGIKDYIIKGIDLDAMMNKIRKALLKVKYGDDFSV